MTVNLHDMIAERDTKHAIRIGGQSHGTSTTFVVDDPATSAVIAEVSDAGAAEATA
jgi:succinate-semialdehyde dehydrogenase / glutarate-semialdehyde dehydrogenase